MTNEPEMTEVPLEKGHVADVDANRIAQIIFEVCPTSKTKALEAANLIVDYLIEIFQNAGKIQ